MKRALLFILSAFMSVLLSSAQSAEQRAESLRSQLRDVIAKEGERQTRLGQIEEELKPENIQRSIAHIGTTRPEDLREQRRLQLERKKAGVLAQLEELAASRTRMEAAVATAEADADRQKMNAATPPPPSPVVNAVDGTTAPAVRRPANNRAAAPRRKKARRLKRHRP